MPRLIREAWHPMITEMEIAGKSKCGKKLWRPTGMAPTPLAGVEPGFVTSRRWQPGRGPHPACRGGAGVDSQLRAAASAPPPPRLPGWSGGSSRAVWPRTPAPPRQAGWGPRRNDGVCWPPTLAPPRRAGWGPTPGLPTPAGDEPRLHPGERGGGQRGQRPQGRRPATGILPSAISFCNWSTAAFRLARSWVGS